MCTLICRFIDNVSSVSFCFCLDFFFLLQSGAAEPTSGLQEGTAGDSTVPIESEMRESGSLELEPSVSVVIPKEPEKAATMPMEPLRAHIVLQEGMLGRKHDMEGSGKKASNRYIQGVIGGDELYSSSYVHEFQLPETEIKTKV